MEDEDEVDLITVSDMITKSSIKGGKVELELRW